MKLNYLFFNPYNFSFNSTSEIKFSIFYELMDIDKTTFFKHVIIINVRIIKYDHPNYY